MQEHSDFTARANGRMECSQHRSAAATTRVLRYAHFRPSEFQRRQFEKWRRNSEAFDGWFVTSFFQYEYENFMEMKISTAAVNSTGTRNSIGAGQFRFSFFSP